MQADWKGRYQRRLAKRASKRGKHAANVRWARERAKRAALSERDPIQVGGRIVERVVRIIGESRVIERVFYEHDGLCDWKRKRREIFTL